MTESDQLRVPCEVYSRIVGYLRPVQAWNVAKKEEFAHRVVFDVSGSVADVMENGRCLRCGAVTSEGRCPRCMETVQEEGCDGD